jgi:hypothetical protein
MVEHAEALFRLYDAGWLAPPVERTCHIAEFVDSMRGVSGKVAGPRALFPRGRPWATGLRCVASEK